MADEEMITTLQLFKSTRERLLTFGKKGETYDDLLNRLMDEAEAREGKRK